MERLLAVQERNGEAQERRVAKAIAEAANLVWTKTPLGWMVQTGSGACYQVDEHGCSCPDHRNRCAGTETRCYHRVALGIKLLAEASPAPAQATARKNLPPMTDAEVEKWDRLYA